MFEIAARFDDFFEAQDLLQAFGLEKGGRVQQFIDQKVIDSCIEGGYIPASPERTLEFSAQLSTEIGSGLVIWNTPYARYQYYGEVYGPNIPDIDPETGVIMGWWSPPGRPKHPTGRKLTYDTAQNAKAGSFWFERMKADKMSEILDEARRVMIQGE